MGDVRNGVDRTLTRRLLEHSMDTRPVCSQCWARHFCGGGCHHDNVMATGGLGTPNPVTCDIFRHSMSLTLEAWARLSRKGKIGGRRVHNDSPSRSEAPVFLDSDRPLKTPGCHVRDLGRERIVYEPNSHEVAVLNATASFIFERCDGARTVADLLGDLQKTFAAPADVLQRDLQRTLSDLRDRHLIST